MKTQSKFLKVVSIIIIILGAIGVLTGIAQLFMRDSLASSYAALGMEAPGIGYYVYTLFVAAAELAAGIVGIMYRSKKSALTAGIVWVVIIAIDIAYSSTITGFSALLLSSFLFPVLYLWGVYQSN